MKNLIFHKLHKKDLKKHDYEIFQEEFPEEIINKKVK